MTTEYLLVDSCENKDIFSSKFGYVYNPPLTTTEDDVDGNPGGAIALGSSDHHGIVRASATSIPLVSGSFWLVWAAWIRIRRPGTDSGGPLFFQSEQTGSLAYNTSYSDAWLEYSSSAGLRVREGSGIFKTLGVTFETDVWYHVEYVHRFGGATTGNWTVYVNGNEVGSGIEDNDGEPWNYLYVTGFGGSTSAYPVYDDIVCAVSDEVTPPRLGMLKVAHFVPTGTAQGQWTGSDADSVDNHLLVDDDDASSADYVEATAGSGNTDLYTHDDIPAGATPVAVQVAAAATLDALGTDDFSIVVESNGSQVETPRVLGAGSPVWLAGDAVSSDPDGSAPWTEAKINAMTFGISS